MKLEVGAEILYERHCGKIGIPDLPKKNSVFRKLQHVLITRILSNIMENFCEQQLQILCQLITKRWQIERFIMSTFESKIKTIWNNILIILFIILYSFLAFVGTNAYSCLRKFKGIVTWRKILVFIYTILLLNFDSCKKE